MPVLNRIPTRALTRVLALSVLSSLVLVLGPLAAMGPAAADPCQGKVCGGATGDGHGDVVVHAGSGGSSGGGAGGVTTPGTAGTVSTCQDGGKLVPCHSTTASGEGYSWSNDLRCYLTPFPGYRPPPTGQTDADGQWYVCARPGEGGRAVWLTTPPTLLPDPATLAEQAVTRMDLSAIRIGIVPRPRPGSMGIIGMPVWMWVDRPTPATYGPIVASATAGPVTVTAIGNVASIDWAMGDRTTVHCTTPGTRYRETLGKQTSPTCGHTYTRTSAQLPAGAYTVTATSHWVITWTGGGQTGTITLDHTAEVHIREGELQVLAQ